MDHDSDHDSTPVPGDGTNGGDLEDLPAVEQLLGADPGPAASAQNLEGVMRRHMRHRRRWTAGVGAVVLALGTGGGVLAAELATTATPAALSGQQPASGSTTFAPGAAAPRANSALGSNFSVPFGVPAPSGLGWVSGGTSPTSGAVGAASGANQGSPGGASSTLVPGPCTIAGCLPSYGDFTVGAAHVTRLFDRSANGIDVRVFEMSYEFSKGGLYGGGTVSVPPAQPTSPPSSGGGGSVSGGSPSPVPAGAPGTSTGKAAAPPSAALPICAIASELVIEVSNPAAVGEFMVPLPASAPKAVDLAAENVVGVEEGSPIAVLVFRTGAGVHEVRASFAGGPTDSMVVVGGVAVLVAPASTGAATYSSAAASVDALGPSGKVVEHLVMPGAPSLAEPERCLPVLPGAAGGSAGSSTGISSPGSSPPGKTSSGSGR